MLTSGEVEARASARHLPGVRAFATIAELIGAVHHDATLVLEPDVGALVARMISEDPINTLSSVATRHFVSVDNSLLVSSAKRTGRGRTVAVAFSTVPTHSSRTLGSTQLYVVMLRAHSTAIVRV